MEGKQRAELAMRNVQMELSAAQNMVKDLDEENRGRHLLEKINKAKQQRNTQQESLKISSEKAELQLQMTRLTEENGWLTSENEKLHQRVHDLHSEVKDHEEGLRQVIVQQTLHNSKLVSESTMLDKERVTRAKLDVELESLRTRLHTSTVQLEKSQHERDDFERRLHGDHEEWTQQLDRKDLELTSLKDKVQAHKLNSVENELQISNTMLLERTNQYQQAQRDLQFYKATQENYDCNYRNEKELNARHVADIESLQELNAKHIANIESLQDMNTIHVADIESLQDGLSGSHHELLSMKQQLERAQHNALQHELADFNIQGKLNVMIDDLKSDHEKASDQFKQERRALKMEIEKLHQKCNTTQEINIRAQTRIGELVDQHDRSHLFSSQQFADTLATINNFKMEIEENYQKVQAENVRLDVELKHEKQKTDMIQRDLADSQKGEEASRDLVLKAAADHKGLLDQEVLSRSKLELRIAQLERNKQETSTHFEEVLDCNETHLSSLHSAFDKERHVIEENLFSVKSQLDHVKRKMRTEVEEKDRVHEKHQQLEAVLEQLFPQIDSHKKQLEQEFQAYKNSVKTDYTSSLQNAKRDIEAMCRQELNEKLNEVNNFLDEQARIRQQLDLSRNDHDSKLRNERKKIEKECTDLRIKYEQSMANLEIKEMEVKRYERLHESEMQWRMEQQYRSTNNAFTLRNKLVADRQKNLMYDVRTKLHSSITQHLEAAPHDQFHPSIRRDSSNIAASSTLMF